MKTLLYTDKVEIERWTGEDMVSIRFKSGDEWYKFVMPEYVARQISTKLDYKLDDINE